MSVELLLLVGSLGAAVAFGWLAFRPWRQQRQERERLGRLLAKDREDATEVEGEKRPSLFRRRLLSAGLNVPPIAVVAVLILIAGAFGAAMGMMLNGNPWVALVAGALALWMLLSVIYEAARWRVSRFETRLVDALDLATGALAAGEEPVEAFEHAAEGAQEPARTELLDLVARLRSSLPVEAAIRPMADRWDCEAVRLFSQLLIAKWEIGGQLAPSLRDITRTVRNGLRLRRQLQASLSSAQVAAFVIAGIPYVLLLFFLWKRPQMITSIWALSWGPTVFFFAILLQIVGFVWLRRILRIEL